MGWFVALILGLSSVDGALASLEGRSGFSGNPGTNGGALCSACHFPSPATPVAMVEILGPTVVEAGQEALYTVLVMGGSGVTAGVNISTANFQGALNPVDGDLQLFGAELSHTLPKGFVQGAATFDFAWTAPAFNGPVTLYAAGNASSGNLDLGGDAIAATTLEVTVVNGAPPPPPEPPPPPAARAVASWAAGVGWRG
ncbi:MAG: choice-of-anchor V domain-containing protein, partial [Candidatus Competibacterales bacterium]